MNDKEKHKQKLKKGVNKIIYTQKEVLKLIHSCFITSFGFGFDLGFKAGIVETQQREKLFYEKCHNKIEKDYDRKNKRKKGDFFGFSKV